MLEKGTDICHISPIFLMLWKKDLVNVQVQKHFIVSISFFDPIVLSSVSHWLSTNYLPFYVQGRRKVWKSGGGARSNMVGIIYPPGWDRDNLSVKNCGGRHVPPESLRYRQPCWIASAPSLCILWGRRIKRHSHHRPNSKGFWRIFFQTKFANYLGNNVLEKIPRIYNAYF